MKLYDESPEARAEARDHLLYCLWLVWACREESEWEAALDAAFRLRARRALTGDEAEMFAWSAAEHAKWRARRIHASRLLAGAEDVFTHAHRGIPLGSEAAA